MCHGLRTGTVPYFSNFEVVEQVIRGAFAGSLHVCRPALERRQAGGSAPPPAQEEEQQTPVPPPREIPKTWVEFVVLDMEGNPATGTHYLVVLPDGSVHEGNIGKGGSVRFESIYPENSVFTLPDLDQEAWERAG
jgi:hypothetical protein